MWDKGHTINSEKMGMGTKHVSTNNEIYIATKHQK